MGSNRRRAAVLPSALVVLVTAGACATTPRHTAAPAPPAHPPTAAERPAAEAGGEGAALGEALARAAAGELSPATLDLMVECRDGGRMRSLRAFGSGIGIWEGRAQIRLDPGQIVELLRALQGARFAELEETYGHPEEDDAVTMMTCRVDVVLAGARKEVVQLREGDQSADLRELARRLLAVCEPSVAAAVTAEDLRDGLAKVARGELAPETWGVTLHRRREAAGAAAEEDGYVLRLSGAHVTMRTSRGATGYGEPRELALTTDEVRELAAAMAAADVAGWPINLWSADYVDLLVHVLQHERSLQARQFAGLDPGAHPAEQAQLERLLALLADLHRRVEAEGVPAAGPARQ
jgi:hypothetical protein